MTGWFNLENLLTNRSSFNFADFLDWCCCMFFHIEGSTYQNIGILHSSGLPFIPSIRQLPTTCVDVIKAHTTQHFYIFSSSSFNYHRGRWGAGSFKWYFFEHGFGFIVSPFIIFSSTEINWTNLSGCRLTYLKNPFSLKASLHCFSFAHHMLEMIPLHRTS